MSISKSCVGKIVKKFKETGSFATATKSGRPKKASKRLDRYIVKEIVKDPFASSKSIQNSLPNDVSISDRTIRKILVDEGYRSYRAKKKPNLKICHVKDRIKFYETFRNYSFEDFSKIIWSDESRICLVYSDKPPLV